MIKEEAIARIQDHMEHHHIGEYPHIKLEEALKLAITALRGPTREQVEKVWKGEWKPTEYPLMNECEDCSVCGYRTPWGHGFDFCPACGSAMTDKGMDIIMKRLGGTV